MNGDQKKTKTLVTSILGLLFAMAMIVFVVMYQLTTHGAGALMQTFVCALVFLLATIVGFRMRPKQLAAGTEAITQQQVWASTDPEMLRKVDQLELMKCEGLNNQKMNDLQALIDQQRIVGNLMTLPANTVISILGYFDVHRCQFKVVQGEYSGKTFYCGSRFIKERASPKLIT